jgi:hypothetical protein
MTTNTTPEPPTGLTSSDALDLWADRAAELAEDAAGFHGLAQVCRLIDYAEKQEAAANAEPFIRGSQGQPVQHPGFAEARLARTAALTALRALTPAKAKSSAAGAALAAKRWGR